MIKNLTKENQFHFFKQKGSLCFKLLIFFALIACSLKSLGQTDVTVRGIVRDTVGGLPGVNIKVSGTNRGVNTNSDGRYTI